MVKVKKRFSGIKQKMLGVLLTVLVFAFSVTGYFSLQKQKKEIFEETARRGNDITTYASEAIALHVVSYDYHAIQIMLDEMAKNSDIVYAEVQSKKGNVMAKAGDASIEFNERTNFIKDIYFGEDRVGQLNVRLNNEDIINRLGKKRQALFIREAITLLLIACGEFLALSFFIARPVQVITKTIESSVGKDGKINSDIPVTSEDEFGVLANVFNSMRRQLNKAQDKLLERAEVADLKLKETNKVLTQQSEELQKINKELKRASITDALTGLHNRHYFEEVLKNDILIGQRHGETNSLIIIDLDHFKKINDTFGHHAGDEVLVSTAKTLKAVMRRTDVLCRIGGEELVCIVRRADKIGAMLVAEKFRKAIEDQKFEFDGVKHLVTASFGVTTWYDHQNKDNIDNVIRDADQALYYSKENGRNQVTHFSNISQDNSTLGEANYG